MHSGITNVPGIRVGHATDLVGLTGCTVILCPAEGAVVGADVRGSAPGTRETDLTRPGQLVERAHAILLSGGSAYGLDAASGVMAWLEENGIGLSVGVGVVPIVPGAVLFDLGVGDAKARPNAAMGYAAAAAAKDGQVEEGNVGAGTGATVGKLLGSAVATKAGLGTASITLPGGAVVGAIVALNAVGDIYDPDTRQIIAGARGPNGFLNITQTLLGGAASVQSFPGTNTTIACVATNARLSKEQVNKVAQMAQNGLARTIDPVHTMFDGDTIFALSCGEIDVDVTTIGTAAARAVERAVLRAVHAATAAGGLPAARDLK
jgi:L-aminopeptidase/D-esterase-like protein